VVRPSMGAARDEETGAGVPDVEPSPARQPVEPSPFRRAVTGLGALAVADGDLRTLLRRVTELASEGVPGIDAASVALGDPAEPELLATSSSLAQSGDGVQHLTGSGPTFDAYRSGRVTATGDLSGDPRYPAIARCAPTEVRSAVALPVPDQGSGAAGVVTLYARGRDALDAPGTADAAAPFVAAAGALIRDARLVAALVTERDQLQDGLRHRAPIEQAKGMIMATRGCGPEEAFRVLVRLSNVANRKLRDVAREYVADGGPPPASDGGAADRRSRRPGGRPGDR